MPTFTCLRASELAPSDWTAWEEIRHSNPEINSPYFSVHFSKIVAGLSHDFYVAKIHHRFEALAYFPFHRSVLGTGRPPAGHLSDYHGLVARQNFNTDLAALLKACRLNTFDFDHVPSGQTSFIPYTLSSAPSPIIDLSSGYEAYHASQSRQTSVIGRIEGQSRLIERDIGPLKMVFHSPDPERLRQLLDWKRSQYARTGVHDVLSSAWTRNFLREIHQTQETDFGGVLSLLFAGDELVAGHFGMRSKEILHYWFPVYNIRHARYSPGMILLLKIVAAASGYGVRCIDTGKGTTEYKMKFHNRLDPLMEGRIELPSAISTLRRSARYSRQFIRQSFLFKTARRLLRRQPDEPGKSDTANPP